MSINKGGIYAYSKIFGGQLFSVSFYSIGITKEYFEGKNIELSQRQFLLMRSLPGQWEFKERSGECVDTDRFIDSLEHRTLIFTVESPVQGQNLAYIGPKFDDSEINKQYYKFFRIYSEGYFKVVDKEKKVTNLGYYMSHYPTIATNDWKQKYSALLNFGFDNPNGGIFNIARRNMEILKDGTDFLARPQVMAVSVYQNCVIKFKKTQRSFSKFKGE